MWTNRLDCGHFLFLQRTKPRDEHCHTQQARNMQLKNEEGQRVKRWQTSAMQRENPSQTNQRYDKKCRENQKVSQHLHLQPTWLQD